jgi:hypothetical protein
MLLFRGRALPAPHLSIGFLTVSFLFYLYLIIVSRRGQNGKSNRRDLCVLRGGGLFASPLGEVACRRQDGRV